VYALISVHDLDSGEEILVHVSSFAYITSLAVICLYKIIIRSLASKDLEPAFYVVLASCFEDIGQ
jgi:hypothetical protein